MGQQTFMKDINKVMLIGRIATAPELKRTTNDHVVCRFVLATNRSWTLENGNKESVAQFHTLIAWNKLGEIVANNARKGDKLYAEGRIEYRKYTDKNGIERTISEVVLNDISLIEAIASKAAPTEAPIEAEEVTTEPIDAVTSAPAVDDEVIS